MEKSKGQLVPMFQQNPALTNFIDEESLLSDHRKGQKNCLVELCTDYRSNGGCSNPLSFEEVDALQIPTESATVCVENGSY